MNLIILILVSSLYTVETEEPVSYQSHMFDKESMISYEVQKEISENMMEKQAIKNIEKTIKDAWNKTP